MIALAGIVLVLTHNNQSRENRGAWYGVDPRSMRGRSLVPQDSRTETEGAAGAADQGSRRGKRRLPRLPVFLILSVSFDLAFFFLPLPLFTVYNFAAHSHFPHHRRQLLARNTKRRYRKGVHTHFVPPLVSVAGPIPQPLQPGQ